MGSLLQKLLGSGTPPSARPGKARNLPVQARAGHLPGHPLKKGMGAQNLPNATVIYGIGASLLFVSSFSLLLAGRWVPGGAVFVLGGCLTGFALHLLKHQD